MEAAAKCACGAWFEPHPPHIITYRARNQNSQVKQGAVTFRGGVLWERVPARAVVSGNTVWTPRGVVVVDAVEYCEALPGPLHVPPGVPAPPRPPGHSVPDKNPARGPLTVLNCTHTGIVYKLEFEDRYLIRRRSEGVSVGATGSSIEARRHAARGKLDASIDARSETLSALERRVAALSAEIKGAGVGAGIADCSAKRLDELEREAGELEAKISCLKITR
jgi:hypothetical protein